MCRGDSYMDSWYANITLNSSLEIQTFLFHITQFLL